MKNCQFFSNKNYVLVFFIGQRNFFALQQNNKLFLNHHHWLNKKWFKNINCNCYWYKFQFESERERNPSSLNLIYFIYVLLISLLKWVIPCNYLFNTMECMLNCLRKNQRNEACSNFLVDWALNVCRHADTKWASITSWCRMPILCK